MPITPAARNSMLTAIGVTHASLHSAFPGNSGANEIAGGSPAYARKAVAFNAASGGARAQSGSALFDVGPGVTVQYVGFWDASSGGNCLSYHPLGNSAAREFIVDIAGTLLRAPAHGFADSNRVVFIGDAVPGGLTEGTVYFVRSAATDTFQVALTDGGAAITLSTQAGAACQVVRIVPEIFGSQGTLTLSGSSIGLNL